MSPAQKNKLTRLVKRSLDFIHILFLALAVIWPVTVVVIGLSIADDPAQRHTDVSAYLSFRVLSDALPGQANLPDNGSDMVMKGRGNLTLNNTQSRLGWYVTGAIPEILLLIFLYGLRTMRQLFASLVEGDTFTDENAERIRRIGYVFIAWHVLEPALQYIGSRIMLDDIAISLPGIQLYPGFELSPGGLFAGFAIIVLSGVLREAADIYRDQSLTI